jgi:hypothetical protein
MDKPDGPPARAKPEPSADPRTEREGRLARALRENLRRRKALQRAPEGDPGTD